MVSSLLVLFEELLNLYSKQLELIYVLPDSLQCKEDWDRMWIFGCFI